MTLCGGWSARGWTEKLVQLFDVEVHEAKGPRGLESRDYAPRLAAFRAQHPNVPVFVWRKRGGRLVHEQLRNLG